MFQLMAADVLMTAQMFFYQLPGHPSFTHAWHTLLNTLTLHKCLIFVQLLQQWLFYPLELWFWLLEVSHCWRMLRGILGTLHHSALSGFLEHFYP